MQNILQFQLTIPTWQIVLFLSLISTFMLIHRVKYCLLTTYLFVFYWIFYLYRADLIAIADGDRIVLAAYHLFGFIIAVLVLYPFISPEQSAPIPMAVGPEMANLRKALLKRIDKMESAIKEAESKAMTEVHQSEEEKFDAEAKAALLETQLEEKAEVLRRKEAALKELEENLNGQIHSLEDEVKQRDGLLAMHSGESDGNTSELEAQASALEAELREKEESLRAGESNASQLEENLNSKIRELKNELKQKEELLATPNGETNGTVSELEAKASVLEAQLLEQQESLRARESNAKELESTLSGKIQELENELRQKEELLQKSQMDDLQRQTTEAELEGLRAELHQRNLILQAREMEVKMIKQSMPERVRELDKSVQRQTEGEPQKTRLGSFLATIEK